MRAQIALRGAFAYGAGSRLESSWTNYQKRNISYRHSARCARIGRSKMRVYRPAKYVSWKVRMTVIKRDRKCFYCGRPVAYTTGSSLKGDRSWRAYDSEGRPFHFDHRIPFSKGGKSTPENVVLSCAKCNLQKGCNL